MKFNVSVLLGNKITGYIVEAATHREAEKIAVEVSDRKNKTRYPEDYKTIGRYKNENFEEGRPDRG